MYWEQRLPATENFGKQAETGVEALFWGDRTKRRDCPSRRTGTRDRCESQVGEGV